MKNIGTRILSFFIIISLLVLPVSAKPSRNYTLGNNEAKNIIAVAIAQEGKNRRDFGWTEPWCGYFVAWCAKTAGISCVPSNIVGGYSSIARIVQNGNGEFYCYSDSVTHIGKNDPYRGMYSGISIYDYLCNHPQYGLNSTGKAHMHQVSRGDFKPKMGDIIIFLKKNDYTDPQFSHVGLVRADYTGGNTVLTVEGNTGTNYKVELKSRSIQKDVDMQIVGFVRPNYKGVTSGSGNISSSNDSNNSTSSNISIKTDAYYTIQNLGCGKMLNVYGSSSKSDTNVTVYQADKTSGQDFKFISKSSGQFVIEPRCATKCALNVYGTSASAGANVNTWTKSGNSTQSWVVDYNSSLKGFVIRSADNPSYVLTATGSANSSNVCIRAYDPSNKYQLWTSSAFSANSTSSPSTPSKPVVQNKTASITTDVSSISLDIARNPSKSIRITVNGDSGGYGFSTSHSNPRAALVKTEKIQDESAEVILVSTVTAKGEGKTTLTYAVTDKDTGKTLATKTVNITVTEPKYTISYNAAGGTGAPASQTKNYKKNITLSSTKPTRSGYTFVGWATSSGGTPQYGPGDAYATDKDVTLYAVWTPVVPENKVVLTLKQNSFTVEAGKQLTIPFTFTGTIGSVDYEIENKNICEYTNGEWKQGTHSGSISFKTMPTGETTVTIILRDKNNRILDSKEATVTVTAKSTSPTIVAYQFNTDKIALKVGETASLSVDAVYSIGRTTNVTDSCKFISSTSGIVEIKGNTIKALKSGTTQISISSVPKGVEIPKPVTVTVSSAAKPTPTIVSYRFSASEITLKEGENSSLKVIAVYSDSSTKDVTDSCELYSSNTKVASIQGGTVIAKKAGTAQISIKTLPAGVTAPAPVKVTVSAPIPTIKPEISLSPSSASLSVGDTQTLTVKTFPSGQNIRISSSDPSIVSLNTENGNYFVRGAKEGTAVITASMTYEGRTYQASCRVTVSNQITDIGMTPSSTTLSVGDSVLFRVFNIYQDGTVENQTESAQLSSSNENVAFFNSEGKLEALSAGTTTITAMLNGYTKTAEVTVTPPEVPSIKQDFALAVLEVGLTRTFTANISVEGQEVEWISSDTNVITITRSYMMDKKVSYAWVETVGEGEATLTARINYNGQVYESLCQMTVTPKQ